MQNRIIVLAFLAALIVASVQADPASDYISEKGLEIIYSGSAQASTNYDSAAHKLMVSSGGRALTLDLDSIKSSTIDFLSPLYGFNKINISLEDYEGKVSPMVSFCRKGATEDVCNIVLAVMAISEDSTTIYFQKRDPDASADPIIYVVEFERETGSKYLAMISNKKASFITWNDGIKTLIQEDGNTKISARSVLASFQGKLNVQRELDVLTSSGTKALELYTKTNAVTITEGTYAVSEPEDRYFKVTGPEAVEYVMTEEGWADRNAPSSGTECNEANRCMIKYFNDGVSQETCFCTKYNNQWKWMQQKGTTVQACGSGGPDEGGPCTTDKITIVNLGKIVGPNTIEYKCYKCVGNTFQKPQEPPTVNVVNIGGKDISYKYYGLENCLSDGTVSIPDTCPDTDGTLHEGIDCRIQNIGGEDKVILSLCEPSLTSNSAKYKICGTASACGGDAKNCCTSGGDYGQWWHACKGVAATGLGAGSCSNLPNSNIPLTAEKNPYESWMKWVGQDPLTGTGECAEKPGPGNSGWVSASNEELMDHFGHSAAEVEAQLVPVTILGKTYRVHPCAKQAFQGVADDLAQLVSENNLQYSFNSYTGTYNWRYINGPGGGTKYSWHSFGIAIDINWNLNPRCGYADEDHLCTGSNDFVTDMPVCFVNAWKKHGFVWGGDFGSYDPMHLEWHGWQDLTDEEFQKLCNDECDLNPTDDDVTVGCCTGESSCSGGGGSGKSAETACEGQKGMFSEESREPGVTISTEEQASGDAGCTWNAVYKRMNCTDINKYGEGAVFVRVYNGERTPISNVGVFFNEHRACTGTLPEDEFPVCLAAEETDSAFGAGFARFDFVPAVQQYNVYLDPSESPYIYKEYDKVSFDLSQAPKQTCGAEDKVPSYYVRFVQECTS